MIETNRYWRHHEERMKNNLVRLLRGFTMIEILVVMAIIAVLLAILFPAFAAARKSAKQTACLAGIYQTVRKMDGGGDTVCPYPVDGVGAYLSWAHPEHVQVPDINVHRYCIQHLDWDGDTLRVPLSGKFIVARGSGGSKVVNAKAVKRLRYEDREWKPIPETGVPPSFPEVWQFPNEDPIIVGRPRSGGPPPT